MLTCLYDVVGYALLGSMYLCVYFHDIWLDPCLHMLICLVSCSSMFMCQVPTCLHVCFYAYMSRSMFSHAYVLGSMFFTCFMLSFMSLCAPCHVCVPRPRLCLSCHVLLQPFCRFIFLSCLLAYGQHPIQTLWSLLSSIHQGPHQKGLDHSYFACLCLLPSMLYACVNLSCSRLCHVWHPQRVRGCVVTYDAHEALFGCSHSVCIVVMPVVSCTPIPFSAPSDDCLPCFFMPPVGFMCIFTCLFT